MNKERLEEVLKILSRYKENQEVVDYYNLFDFNKNATLDEIKSQIKSMRLQVLFHPDQINYIPEQHRNEYLKMIELSTDAINAFDNERSKEMYDNKLKSVQKFNNNNSSYHNTSENYTYNNDKTEDLEEVYLMDAIIINSQKYGFDYTKEALREVIEKNYFGSFTRTNNAREIVTQLGNTKILEIITRPSLNETLFNLDQILMNYFSAIMYKNPVLKKQVDCIEQACVKTIYKYDMLGNFGQTSNALLNYIQSGNARGFTNTDNARSNLINNVKFEDTLFITRCLLNSKRHENEYFSYDNIKNMNASEITNIYANDLYCKIKSKQYNNTEYGGNSSYGSR